MKRLTGGLIVTRLMWVDGETRVLPGGIDRSIMVEARGLEDIEFRSFPNPLPPVMSSNASDDAYALSAFRSAARHDGLDGFRN